MAKAEVDHDAKFTVGAIILAALLAWLGVSFVDSKQPAANARARAAAAIEATEK